MSETAFGLLLMANGISLLLVALLWLDGLATHRRLLRRIIGLEEIVCPRVELRVAMIRADKAELRPDISNWME